MMFNHHEAGEVRGLPKVHNREGSKADTTLGCLPHKRENGAKGALSNRLGIDSQANQSRAGSPNRYERINMMPHPPRSTSGRRAYGEVETRTLAFIRRARELGFSLDEIRALLALSAHHGDEMCVEVRQLAANHLGDVRAKIADLRAMERILADAVRRCDEGESARCPLIDALSKP